VLCEWIDEKSLLRKKRKLVSQEQGDTAIAFAMAPPPPCDFARSDQRIEAAGA